MSNKFQQSQHWTVQQLIPIILTVVVFLVLAFLLWLEVTILNYFTSDDIIVRIHPADITVGIFVYLKTAIDFAIFIGRLMEKNPGLNGRISIEIGTAIGNALGTMAILLIWVFFKEVDWLLALMVFLAGLVLLRLAEDSLEHINFRSKKLPAVVSFIGMKFELYLSRLNSIIGPFLSKIIPSKSLDVVKQKSFMGLFAMSFTVPFILGLDDFAGYVPLFNIVNVFGFGLGVFLGHMILNIFLYISPTKTIQAVKNPIISFLGGVAFVVLAVWGFIEAFKLVFVH